MNYTDKRTWAEIDLGNIEHNYRMIRKAIPDGCRFLGVVKADAYGHGAVEISRKLQEIGADYLAVSCLDEAMELRNNGISMPILILGHTPAQFSEVLVENNLTQTVANLAKAQEYSKEAQRLDRNLKIHIKVDTGMSRLGFLVAGDYFEHGINHIYDSCVLPNIDVEGIYTHFAVSDEDGDDNREYTLKQFRLFIDVIKALNNRGVDFRIRHCANSGAVVKYPEMALDMVRPGLLLYGYGDEGKLNLKPCMSLKTRVATIKYFNEGIDVSYGRHFTTNRRTKMGVLAIGYADGLMRALSNKVSFYCEGEKIRQCGNICMDMCMADLTDNEKADINSVVEIFGENNDINELSRMANTIPYEIVCNISKRVPRVYK